MSQLITQSSLAVPEAQKQAWITLAGKKNELAADLTKRELALQQILTGKDLPKALADYRKGHTELVEARKSFTSIITDKLIAPMMEWEKRSDPKTNAQYLSIAAQELADRKKANADAELQQNIATERGQFKAHFQNEYMRIANEYRTALRQIIQDTYVACLHAKTPPDGVDSAIAVARLTMIDVKVGQPAKFIRVNLPSEDAAAMYKQLPTLNKSEIFEEIQAELTDKFAMYVHDLANAEVASENAQREFQAVLVEEAQDLKQEQAANTLMASAESFIISDIKSVTQKTVMVIEDNSESWILRVMTAFIANFPAAFSKTRNKKYSALTVAQMAAALDACGVKVEGVQYTTVEK